MGALVDAQLPPALARAIAQAGHVAEHVMDVGLLTAADNAAVIITKDEDSAAMHNRRQRAVCIVWIRIGNVSRAVLLERFLPLLPTIVSLVESGETLIEIR